MRIVHQSPLFSSTLRPAVPLRAAPPPRRALPAPRLPKIAGLLPAPQNCVVIAPVKREKRVVEAEIVNPLLLIDIRRNPKAWWAEFERIYGPSKTTEDLDAEIEASTPVIWRGSRGSSTKRRRPDHDCFERSAALRNAQSRFGRSP